MPLNAPSMNGPLSGGDEQIAGYLSPLSLLPLQPMTHPSSPRLQGEIQPNAPLHPEQRDQDFQNCFCYWASDHLLFLYLVPLAP